MKKTIFALCTALVLCIAFSNTSFSVENPLDAQNVVKALDENRMKFDMQYKNKEVVIKGTIAKIEEKKGKYLLSLSNGDRVPNPFKAIVCTFDKPDELMDLKAGEDVSVTGTYKGKQNFEIGSMTLFKCKLVK
jgi:hypothetical protein